MRSTAAKSAPLSIRPHSTNFLLADGTEIKRQMGDAIFRIDGQQGASPVIFGQRDDAALLGTIPLGSLGRLLDPMKRILRPLPMVLVAASAPERYRRRHSPAHEP
jgi:hypothetical protein